METSKKPLFILLAGFGTVVALGALALLWGISINNLLVSTDEEVKASWAQVQNVYQRRADLVPNLVATVKGYAKQEKEVLTEVTKARASVGQVNINDPNQLKAFQDSQNQLTSALSRLMVVVEKYPDLKSNQNFLELQAQLEGTENRITVERMRFNDLTRKFNSLVKRFPQSLVASLRGFEAKPYFEAQAGAQSAPQVNF